MWSYPIGLGGNFTPKMCAEGSYAHLLSLQLLYNTLTLGKIKLDHYSEQYEIFRIPSQSDQWIGIPTQMYFSVLVE